ncbi:MAG: AMP-binding protein, partial [SAR324 cluster bacterium]|nr:AMP-binding protein [SAR324 cluster bacterium]
MAVNRVPMTPLTFLQRSARVFPERIATVYEGKRVPYRTFYERVCRMAQGLRGLHLPRQGRVAVLAPNVPMVLEAHFGVPLAGGVLVAINTRLSAHDVSYIINHSGSEVLLVDRGMLGMVREMAGELPGLRRVIVCDDPLAGADDGWRPTEALDYEEFLAGASAEEPEFPVRDEDDLISLNYTSGTTGKPKGVMFTHRGAYLNALSDCLQNGLTGRSVYLWTLPMFHCNGWCFTWAVPASGATSICMRAVEPRQMRELIESEGVTNFCGAPIVLNMLANLPDAEQFRFANRVRASTGGAPPSPTLLAAMDRMNVEAIHLYGLTETYGPITLCEVQDDWLKLPLEDYARQVARQGVAHPLAGEVTVLDGGHNPVPADAQTMGEVCVRG